MQHWGKAFDETLCLAIAVSMDNFFQDLNATGEIQ
jgi:hypothetical protein